MIARRVSLRLKPNSVPEFTQRLEMDVIPLLRKQQGFQDELTCFSTDGTAAFGISLWDRKEDAEAYNSGPYQEVVRILGKVIDGTPEVKTFQVSNSTFHNIAAPVTH